MNAQSFPVRIVPAPLQQEPTFCTFAELLRDNPDLFTPQETEAAQERLKRGEHVQIGGGAAAAFTIEPCSVEEWTRNASRRFSAHAFASALETALHKSGLSKRAFAASVGIAHTSINRYLAGATPALDEAIKLATHLGITLDELVYGPGRSNNAHPVGYPLPIIHSNGTGIRMLTEGYDDARAKLRAARAAFDQIEFNGRDYYTHPDAGAFQSARSVREDVAAKFEEIAAYLDAHLEHLEDPRAEAEKQNTATANTSAHRRR